VNPAKPKRSLKKIAAAVNPLNLPSPNARQLGGRFYLRASGTAHSAETDAIWPRWYPTDDLRASGTDNVGCERKTKESHLSGTTVVAAEVGTCLTISGRLGEGGCCMRKVEIVEDQRSQRCWVAMDAKSGEPVMRMHDKELLRRICQGLEWSIVHTSAQRSERRV
jgi:hypothetical protein